MTKRLPSLRIISYIFTISILSYTLLGAQAPIVTEWTVPIVITNGNETLNLIIGNKQNASDAFDPDIDALLPPPAFNYYAALAIPGRVPFLSHDFRNPDSTTNVWSLAIINATDMTSKISWDIDNFPTSNTPGVFTLGTTNMLTQDSLMVTGNQTLAISFVAPLSNTCDSLNCSNNGDVNCDGVLTPFDALCAFIITLNGGKLSEDCDVSHSECEVIASDVTCDDKVTSADALAIFARFLQNLPPAACFAIQENKN